MLPTASKTAVAVAVLLCLALVGLIDRATGAEIRIAPLYFLPLVLASWHFGRPGAVAASMLATATWILALYSAGRHYSHGYVWEINFVTQGTAFLAVSLIVAFLHEALEREVTLSHSDSLTGLGNSRAFFARAGEALALCHRNRRPVVVAYIDLDNFKVVNDTLGHQQGDQLLRETAAVFVDTLRESDIVARLGGDEFAILLPEATPEAARTVLEKIRDRLARVSHFTEFAVSASIGAVAHREAPADLHGLVSAADAAMYRAKQGGKNRVEVVVQETP